MTSKKYFYNTIVFSFFTISAIILFNIYMNAYGLWGNAKGKSIKIWHDERTSKYLLSYNYIPTNFDGILIGPSVSANLDTKKIAGFKIYNASLNGGNISELKFIADNVIQRGNLKFIIICLSPYITKDHGRKTSSIDPREYWGALGSKQMLELYIDKVFRKVGLREDRYNDHGYNDYNLIREKEGMQIATAINKPDNDTTKNSSKYNGRLIEDIDEVAYGELSQIVNLARQKSIRVIGFYYPYYIEHFNKAAFKTYKVRIDKIFTNQDFIWDMNTDKYLNFRSDLRNYYDKGHFSWKGADFIISEINNKLSIVYNQHPKPNALRLSETREE